MITPGSSHPIADYLKTVPKSLINYSELFENNLQKFKHRYLYKIIHEEISSVNDIWFIDSHQLPIWVKYFINESEFIIIKPWITLIIDGCSDCVVSCVLTKVPNHNATASCIAHAVAITDDDIFFGTCNYLICDNGREFKNTYISNHKVVEDWPPYEEYDFELSDSLLDVLRITQINNLPYQPWNNKIEPCHKAIDRELAKLHPNGFSNKKHGLKPRQIYRIENNPKLSTFEELADLIYNYVIININNSPANKDKISRLDKYLNSPKIESFVPSFASISLLLENRENVKVKQASVKYKNTAYYGDCLNLLPDKAEVTIYQSYDINYPYLQAFYKSENTCRYLGTLYPKEPISFVENNEYKKEVQFNIQQRGLNIYRKRYEAILQIGELVSSPLMYASKIKDPFKGNDINKDVSLSYYIKKQKELELDSYYLKQNELIIKKELIKSIATNINSIKYTK